MTAILSTSSSLSSLVAINELALARPVAGAPARLVADWYERKALVLYQIAAESRTPTDHDTYETLATQAHAHAARLLTGGGSR